MFCSEWLMPEKNHALTLLDSNTLVNLTCCMEQTLQVVFHIGIVIIQLYSMTELFETVLAICT